MASFDVSIDTSIVFNFNKPNKDWHMGYSQVTVGWRWANTKLVRYSSNTAIDGYYCEFGIPPNTDIIGFSYQSVGLPTIVNGYCQGATGLISFDAEPPEEVKEKLDSLQDFPRITEAGI